MAAASVVRVLDPYAEPRLRRSLADLATSVLPYLALLVAMYFALRLSIVLTLLLAVPTAGFMIRTFIVFHDCAHGSFLRTKRGNELLGAVVGVLVWLPFRSWRHEHAVHHATSGDLDRRGVGDITTLTIAEYLERPWWSRLGYRLFRNPIVMFGFGWLLVLVLKPRFVPRSARPRIRNSILGTDLALALVIAGLWYAVGWRDLVLVLAPVLVIAGAAGIWLFYVQHQFEDAYWQTNESWRYDDAALQGSSYLKLPRVLQFFTGNIGFHHVHHLSARIPNYNLQIAHDQNEQLQAVPQLSIRDGLRATRLKLWDEQQGRLVGFREAHAHAD
ncbi:MAG TPA: fatty acid desaturase [Gaiellaceae bacterium]|nr:fatty acid desaturase [Gaiellaceae bacterium]